jgi:hypothetical protein
VSDEQGLPRSPDEVTPFMAGLTFEPAPEPAEERRLLESLPASGAGVMVVRSLRLPAELDEAVAAAAKAADVPKTAWIRQAIETALAMQSEDDQPISRADALRALTLLRPVRRAFSR